MKDRVAIFIDAGYWLKFCSACGKRVDYNKFANFLAAGKDILRVYYYDCLPFQSAAPTDDEKQRLSKAQRFVYTLERLPHYEVRLGKLAKHQDNQGRVNYTQKRVDLMLGCDLVTLSAKQAITEAVLVAGDSDFIIPVKIAKNEGVRVTLLECRQGSTRPHDELLSACDLRKPFLLSDFNKIVQA